MVCGLVGVSGVKPSGHLVSLDRDLADARYASAKSRMTASSPRLPREPNRAELRCLAAQGSTVPPTGRGLSAYSAMMTSTPPLSNSAIRPAEGCAFVMK